MRNIGLLIEYDGKDFSGWQVQPGERTVQGELEEALRALTKEEVKLTASGRTDSRVHAKGQVANFKTNSSIPADRFKLALNTYLADDLVIKDSFELDLDFHSRFDALSKKYRYVIYNGAERTALYRNYTYFTPYKLDFELMKKNIKYFEGRHDFIGFMSSKSSVEDTVREIYSIDIEKDGDFIYIDIEGNGFLYNMVRIIAGTMIDIGRGKIDMSVEDILLKKDRKYAGQTAGPEGLFLEWVKYSRIGIDKSLKII